MKSVFECTCFSEFFAALTHGQGKRDGLKSELAKAVGVHAAYISRVISGRANLSLEQAERVSAYLNQNPDEKRFLLLLLQAERAGTRTLKQFFNDQLEQMRAERLNIKDRIPKSKQIGLADQAIYYSAWYYQAIHVLISIPRFREVSTIAETLSLPKITVESVLTFLESVSIIRPTRQGWEPGEYHLHLDRSSPFIRQHHANWRSRATQSLERAIPEDIHYSGAFSLSAADAKDLKEQLVFKLNESLKQIQSSPEEVAYALCLDFFEI